MDVNSVRDSMGLLDGVAPVQEEGQINLASGGSRVLPAAIPVVLEVLSALGIVDAIVDNIFNLLFGDDGSTDEQLALSYGILDTLYKGLFNENGYSRLDNLQNTLSSISWIVSTLPGELSYFHNELTALTNDVLAIWNDWQFYFNRYIVPGLSDIKSGIASGNGIMRAGFADLANALLATAAGGGSAIAAVFQVDDGMGGCYLTLWVDPFIDTVYDYGFYFSETGDFISWPADARFNPEEYGYGYGSIVSGYVNYFDFGSETETFFFTQPLMVGASVNDTGGVSSSLALVSDRLLLLYYAVSGGFSDVLEAIPAGSSSGGSVSLAGVEMRLDDVIALLSLQTAGDALDAFLGDFEHMEDFQNLLDEVTGGMESVFPFCVPAVLKHVFGLLEADAALPKFDVSIFGATVTLDMGATGLASLGEITRWVCRITLLVLLLVNSRNFIFSLEGGRNG